jgi:hypothetical protein
MSILEMSEEEKKAIRKQHEDATKADHDRRVAEKGGLKPPEKPKEDPKKEEKK